ncbi:MAG: tetratricopeptide repeat protein [bacterium]
MRHAVHWALAAATFAVAMPAAEAATAREELLAVREKLAAKRHLDDARGVKALVAFAERYRKDAALAAEVLYDAGRLEQRASRHKPPEALQTLLERYPDEQPWAALATLELAQALDDHDSTREKAIALYRKFLALEGQPSWRRAQARYGLAYALQEEDEYQESLAEYRGFLEAFPTHRRRCADALAAVGALLVRLKRPDEAYDTYEKLAAEYPWPSASRSDLLLSIAQAYRAAENRDGARAAYERLLRDTSGTDSRRTYAYRGLAMLLLQEEEAEAAIAVYRRMAEDPRLSAAYRVRGYSHIFELLRKDNDYPRLIHLAYQLIAEHPSRVLASDDDVYEELVDALIVEGRVEEALAMAGAYYRLSQLGESGSRSVSQATVQKAILTVVRALKAREGGLRAANAFLNFIGHGPEGRDGRAGTKDDLPNPLAEHRLPPQAERDRLFTKAEQRLRPDPRQLGYLYVCWDKPTEALRAFRRHYLEARGQTRTQAAATRLARLMRAYGCPEAEVDTFFDFQNHGPHGPDGKPDTKDDLKDPILERK